MPNRRTHISVVCALIERHGRLLVAKRGPERSMAGLWEFPGGKIRAGESADEAIVREIEEELGCTVRPIKVLLGHTHDYPDITVTLLPFLCEVVEGEPRPIEHAELRWAAEPELLSFDWSAADLPILKRYLADK